MKGCTSYEIVRRMAQGMTPQQAADSVVFELEDNLMSRFGRVGDLSVVCMNNRGEFGAATNIKNLLIYCCHSPTTHSPSILQNVGTKRRITSLSMRHGCRPMRHGSVHQ